MFLFVCRFAQTIFQGVGVKPGATRFLHYSCHRGWHQTPNQERLATAPKIGFGSVVLEWKMAMKGWMSQTQIQECLSVIFMRKVFNLNFNLKKKILNVIAAEFCFHVYTSSSKNLTHNNKKYWDTCIEMVKWHLA